MHLDYYHVGIYTVDEISGKLKFRASSLQCQPNQRNPLEDLDDSKGLIHTASRTGQEFVVKDVTKDPLYVYIDILPDTKAEAVLPLKVENRILGVLDVQSDQAGAFHENDMLVLRSLADSIALAVETARLFRTVEQNATRVNAVAEISAAISSILELDELLKKVVTIIEDRFSIPFVHIFTVHYNRRKVIFEAGTGPHTQKLKPNAFAFDLDAEIGIIPHVARTGEPLLANDISQEPRYLPTRYFPQKIKSELTVPLRYGDNVLGVLDMQSDQIDRFTQSDLECSRVSRQASLNPYEMLFSIAARNGAAGWRTVLETLPDCSMRTSPCLICLTACLPPLKLTCHVMLPQSGCSIMMMSTFR